MHPALNQQLQAAHAVELSSVRNRRALDQAQHRADTPVRRSWLRRGRS